MRKMKKSINQSQLDNLQQVLYTTPLLQVASSAHALRKQEVEEVEKNNTDLLQLAVTQGKRTPLRAAEPASTDVPASDSLIPGSSTTNKDLFIEREKPQANRPNGSFCSSSLRVTVAPEPQTRTKRS